MCSTFLRLKDKEEIEKDNEVKMFEIEELSRNLFINKNGSRDDLSKELAIGKKKCPTILLNVIYLELRILCK